MNNFIQLRPQSHHELSDQLWYGLKGQHRSRMWIQSKYRSEDTFEYQFRRELRGQLHYQLWHNINE